MNIIKTIRNDFYFLKYVYQYSKSYVIGEAVVAVLDGLLPLLNVIIPKIIIDILIYGNDFNKIVYYIFLYVILQVTASLTNAYITEKYINLNGHLYSMHFLLLINKKTVTLDMQQLDDPAIHQKIALAEDLIYKGIGMDLINNFFEAISSIVIIISTALIIFNAGKLIIIVILIFSIFSILLNMKNETWLLSQRNENVYLSRILNYYIRIMGDKTCSKEMRIYGFVDWIMKKYHITLKKLKKRLKKLYNKSLIIKIYSIVLENIKSNGIYLYLAWLAFAKKITIGGFTQYFNATSEFSGGVLTFAGFITNLNINGKYIESFREFMEIHSDIALNNKNNNIDILNQNDPISIQFKDVCFKYLGSQNNILNNINYTFESGKVYVIVGENGVGKTTLVNLISRLYDPVSGIITLNNVPIKNYDYNEYKNLFSIVFQDFKYFAFTLAENIALNEYNPDSKAVIERINQCLETAGLSNKVKTLPDGINTNLDKIFYEDGTVLSGGENQKLAFARALFHNSKILILDEPSSALDPIAEDELLRSFKKIAKDKLVIYISHRLSSATLADQIIYIKDGTVYEQGSHKELMECNGYYAKYFNTQAKYYNKGGKEYENN